MIAQTCRDNLLAIAGAYAKATGSSLPYVSRKFYGNVTFLDEFKSGDATISLKKFDLMVAEFRKNWPKGVDWPHLRAAMIARPRRRAK